MAVAELKPLNGGITTAQRRNSRSDDREGVVGRGG